MLGAGKDCTELFDRYHRWVNISSILGKCVVGILIDEQQKIEEGDENEDEDAHTAADAKQVGDKLGDLKVGNNEKNADSSSGDAKADSK